jgi:hypothetical protein
MTGSPQEFGKAIHWNGPLGHLGPGDYVASASVKIPPQGKLELDHARITRTADLPLIVASSGATGAGLSGSAIVDGGGFERPFLLAMNLSGVDIGLDLQISRARAPAIFVRGASNVKVTGNLRSPDSQIIRAVDTSALDISGVQSTYQSDPGGSAIRVVSSGKGGVTSDVHVHDCFIDGGGFFSSPGALINIGSDAGQEPISGVRLENIELRGTIRPRDGLDIGRCRQVTIRNVVGRNVNTLISAQASEVDISDVLAVECFGQAVAIGDPQYQSSNLERCTVRDRKSVV